MIVEPLDPRVQLGLQFAADLSKQLITLAASILALTITFLKDILKRPSRAQVVLVSLSWTTFLLSVVAGIWSLMALTGLAAPLSESRVPTTIGPSARIPAAIQLILFAVGAIAIFAVGVLSLRDVARSKFRVDLDDE